MIARAMKPMTRTISIITQRVWGENLVGGVIFAGIERRRMRGVGD